MNKLVKTGVVIAGVLLGGTALAEGHAKEWTFNSSKDGKKSDVAVSACYSDNNKSRITYNWYPDSTSYENSVVINCGCNENLLLNEQVLVKLDGLSTLVADGLPSNFKTHTCVANDASAAAKIDPSAN